MSGKRAPAQVPDLTGLSLQTSSMTVPTPYAGGLTRGSPNLFFYTDYTAHKHSSKGGKGGGGKTTTYTYSATIGLAICEGSPGGIHGISRTWINQGVVSGFSAPGFTLFTGTIPQAPWSYLAGAPNIPSSIYKASSQDAFGYQGIAYLAAANYDLGASPTVPQHSFEIQAPTYNTGYTGAGDADCALEIQRFLTDPEAGALFPAAFIDTDSLLSSGAATTTGDSAYQTYCRAMGWGISPFLNSQEDALNVLARWCQITNTAPVWTGYNLKFVPFGDAQVTGHGVTYLPPTAAVFSFGDDQYVQDNDTDPVDCGLGDWFDASNAIALECRDRDQSYDPVPIDYIDQTQNQMLGRRYASTIQAHEICHLPMAYQVVSLLGQRMAYVRETHTYKVAPELASVLEPMDCGTITELALGASNFPVRIREMEEQDDGSWQIIVEEFPGTTGSPSGATTQGGIRGYNNQLVAPDPVNPPIIFEPNAQAAAWLNHGSGVPVLAILASGGAAGVNDPNWGGCVVNISTDGGTTYGPIGTINQSANQGALSAGLATYGGANPDTGHTLSVALAESAGVLYSAATPADAAAGVTLGIVQDGVCSTSYELIGPQTATLTGANAYNLTNLYRGILGTAPGAHSSGALYGRLDSATFVFPLPTNYLGVALKIKLQSFNVFDAALEDLSTCAAYTYTPTGTGYGGGAGGVPTTPTGLTATGGAQAATLAWNANPGTDHVTGYRIYRAAGLGASFGSAALVATVAGQTWTDTGLAATTGYTCFLEAENPVGASSPTVGVDVTTTNVSQDEAGFGFNDAGLYLNNEFLGQAIWSHDLTFTNADPDSNVIAAPGSEATSTSVFRMLSSSLILLGTITFAAGSRIATVAWVTSPYVHPATTPMLVYAPATADATLGNVTGRVAGRIS